MNYIPFLEYINPTCYDPHPTIEKDKFKENETDV